MYFNDEQIFYNHIRTTEYFRIVLQRKKAFGEIPESLDFTE